MYACASTQPACEVCEPAATIVLRGPLRHIGDMWWSLVSACSIHEDPAPSKA